MNYSVRQARESFSQMLRSAQAGETVVITHKGKPIAKLSSVAEGELDQNAWLSRLDDLRASIKPKRRTDATKLVRTMRDEERF